MKSRLSLGQIVFLEMHRSLVDRNVASHPLRQLFWECTLRCNLSCRHCGSDCKTKSDSADMPLEDFLKVLDNVAQHTDPHHVNIVITGGEPLMRHDLERCGREIYRRGFPWGMVTNGYALTEERFRSLRSSGLHSITVSLDGLETEHNWMRGREGSWKRAADAIRIIAESGITSDVVTCVNARNIGKLSDIKAFLVGLGVRKWRIFTVFPQGRAKDDPEMSLTGAQLRQVMDFIVATRKEGRIGCNFACEGFLGPYEGKVRDYYFSCIAGVNVASVLADGSISACSSIRSGYHQGNIHDDDFWSVWTEGFGQYRDRSWMRMDECADCRYFRYCRGNGMHLRDEDGHLVQCLLNRMGR